MHLSNQFCLIYFKARAANSMRLLQLEVDVSGNAEPSDVMPTLLIRDKYVIYTIMCNYSEETTPGVK